MVKIHTKNKIMKNYTELTIYTSHLGSEIVSDILWNYTECGVVISDIEDVLALAKEGKTWDYIDEEVLKRDKKVIVKGYFEIENQDSLDGAIKDILALKNSSSLDVGSLEMIKKDIDGDLWHEQWKEFFRPIKSGKVVVVPEWIKYDKKEDEIIVRLDSNMAFGTGEHETTKMCIKYLCKYVKGEDTVIDVGCGSGILGISAAKLGAKKVLMTDLDECAIQSSSHNCQLNNIDCAEILLKNLLDDSTLVGDIIVCNIMAEVLVYFSKQIKNNLKSKGLIILSGILVSKLEMVKNAYLENGFEFVEQNIMGEWSALVLKRID